MYLDLILRIVNNRLIGADVAIVYPVVHSIGVHGGLEGRQGAINTFSRVGKDNGKGGKSQGRDIRENKFDSRTHFSSMGGHQISSLPQLTVISSP